MRAVKSKYNDRFNYKKLISPFTKERTRAVVNPFLPSEKQKSDAPARIFIYEYDANEIKYIKDASIKKTCAQFAWPFP